MNKQTKVRLLQSLAVAIIITILVAAVDLAAQAQNPEPPVEIWLVVDGTAIGTVKPGTFEYDLAANMISVDTNELIYGCQQDVIFRDRFQQR